MDFLQYVILTCVINLGSWEALSEAKGNHENGSDTASSSISGRLEQSDEVCPPILDTISDRKSDIWSYGEGKHSVSPFQRGHKEFLSLPSRTETALAAIFLLSGWAISPEVNCCCSANSNTALQEVLSWIGSHGCLMLKAQPVLRPLPL